MGGVLPPVGQRQHMYVPAAYGRGIYGYPIPDPVVMSPTSGIPPPPSLPPPQTHLHNNERPSFPLPPSLHPHHHPANLPIGGGGDSPTAPLPHGILPQHAIQSPVQILGHTLSTSIFSPPPSAGPSSLFMNQSSNSAIIKPPNSPGHTAVGSSTLRYSRFEPPQPTSINKRADINPTMTDTNNSDTSSAPYKAAVMSDTVGLPPRLAQRGMGGANNVTTNSGGGGTRYQNQRHPSNRSTVQGKDTVIHNNTSYHQYSGNNTAANGTTGVQVYSGGVPSRREPLLPTPNEMIKLDTGITGELYT